MISERRHSKKCSLFQWGHLIRAHSNLMSGSANVSAINVPSYAERLPVIVGGRGGAGHRQRHTINRVESVAVEQPT